MTPLRHAQRRPTGCGLAVACVLLVVLPCLGSTWGYEAQWTRFDCVGESCTYQVRRVISFPLAASGTVARRTLAAHPEWLVLRVLDPNRGTSEINLRVDSTELRVFGGWRAETVAKRDAIVQALARADVPIHESDSPHPFGFVALTMLVLIWLLALFGLVLGVWQRLRSPGTATR